MSDTPTSDGDGEAVCREVAPRVELGSCVRGRGHDGAHRFWAGVDVGGGRKSAIWLYEPMGDGSGFLKPVCHGDFEGRCDEDCAIFLSALTDAAVREVDGGEG